MNPRSTSVKLVRKSFVAKCGPVLVVGNQAGSSVGDAICAVIMNSAPWVDAAFVMLRLRCFRAFSSSLCLVTDSSGDHWVFAVVVNLLWACGAIIV